MLCTIPATHIINEHDYRFWMRRLEDRIEDATRNGASEIAKRNAAIAQATAIAFASR